MNVLIIDNDSHDAEHLQALCNSEYPDLENVSTCCTETVKIVAAAEQDPDIVFINKKDWLKKGIELLNADRFNKASTVITTTDKNAALDAFKLDAAGYLTKPVQKEDLLKVVDQILEHKEEPSENGDLGYFKKLIESDQINKIALTTLEGYTLVSYNDIVRCEAQGNYTNVYFFDGSFLMLTKTLKHYGNILSKKGFYRVHKTHLVNLNYIISFHKGKNNYVLLKDGTQIEVSVRKKDLLLQKLTT